MKAPSISIVIPTYNRGDVLLDTIDLLLNQRDRANEILIIDQTNYDKDDPVARQLQSLADADQVIWVQRSKPSIPEAMNQGLITAKSYYVLFLDDDVHFDKDFIAQHRTAIEQSQGSAHIGQILQPGEISEPCPQFYRAGSGLWRDLTFPFRSDKFTSVHNCMAGNLLVTRQLAIECGGFDEQFSGVAYRFETEFCRRMIAYTGTPFYFAPEASLNHLRLSTGGTRAKVRSFLTSSSPVHSQGDYYFALRCGRSLEALQYIVKRFLGGLMSRFYLKKPWWIPVRVLGEIRGLIAAIRKKRQGPKFIT